MICDICRKNKATIIYTEVINGEKNQTCLCDECAVSMNLQGLGKNNKSDTPMGSILSGILSSYMERYIENKTSDNSSKAVCPTCGMSFSTFMRERLLGCPDCYSTFSVVIEKQLKSVQPGTSHVGKVPVNATVYELKKVEPGPEKVRKTQNGNTAPSSKTKSAGKTTDIGELRLQIKEAVQKEDFMLAAKLRDRIKELENTEKDKGPDVKKVKKSAKKPKKK
jgi:protein arginine kinase activator